MSNDDPIIEAAKRDLAALDAKRHELESFLALYEKYKSTGATTPAATVTAPLRSPPADKVMSAVHDILSERRDALTLAALFDELMRRGIVIGGQHPKQNLSQKLSAHPQLKSYGKRGWYFADTVPPCLQPQRRLSESDLEYEEGPDVDPPRPLQWNGETGVHPA